MWRKFAHCVLFPMNMNAVYFFFLMEKNIVCKCTLLSHGAVFQKRGIQHLKKGAVPG